MCHKPFTCNFEMSKNWIYFSILEDQRWIASNYDSTPLQLIQRKVLSNKLAVSLKLFKDQCFILNWAVLSDEQMRWPFSLLNNEQRVATGWGWALSSLRLLADASSTGHERWWRRLVHRKTGSWCPNIGSLPLWCIAPVFVGKEWDIINVIFTSFFHSWPFDKPNGGHVFTPEKVTNKTSKRVTTGRTWQRSVKKKQPDIRSTPHPVTVTNEGL